MLNIIITAAGLGSRFKEAGYDMPKFEIMAHNKTLFEWSLLSLNSFKNVKYYLIVRKETNSRDFIERKMKELNLLNYEIIELDYMTSGQAETAYLAIKQIDDNDEILVYNIDTYINPKFLLPTDIKGDGFIPCFNAPGEHWSFVKLGEDEKAIEVREKVKISDNASLGVYYFKSAKLYKDIYNKYYKGNDNLEKNERYIAPMYNKMIEDGLEVYISTIPYEEVHVLGTPDELNYFIENYRE